MNEPEPAMGAFALTGDATVCVSILERLAHTGQPERNHKQWERSFPGA
jgi:hypothetical protein